MPTMMVAMRVVMTLTTTCAPSALLAQDENRTKMQEDDITDKTGNNSNYPVHPGDAPDKIAYDKWIRDTVDRLRQRKATKYMQATDPAPFGSFLARTPLAAPADATAELTR